MPRIHQLEDSTSSLLSSGQHITTTASLVKELIDNSLDAGARSIDVEVSPDGVDFIQVKDNGHGIRPDDIPLLARQACTSKISCFDDLVNLGGRYLGFRGMALSSIARISGAMEVVTRIETEQAGIHVQFDQQGKIISQKPKMCVPGTTVIIKGFFRFLPVRQKQITFTASKQLSGVQTQVQLYAIARPGVHEGRQSTIADAARNVFGTGPASKCQLHYWSSALGKVDREEPDLHMSKTSHYAISAVLPKSGFDANEISGYGQFLSIDFRPVTSGKGTMKKISVIYKRHLQQCTTKDVKNPLACINIMCPVGSYDPNTEPAKDDILFTAEEEILSVMEQFLSSIYVKNKVEEHQPGIDAPVAAWGDEEIEAAGPHVKRQLGRRSHITNTTAGNSDFSDLESLFGDDTNLVNLEEDIRPREFGIPIRLSSRTPSVAPQSMRMDTNASGSRLTDASIGNQSIGFDTQDLREIAAEDEAFLLDPRPRNPFEAAKWSTTRTKPPRLAPRPDLSALDNNLPKNDVEVSSRAATTAPENAVSKPLHQTRLPDQFSSSKLDHLASSAAKASSSSRKINVAAETGSRGPMDAFLRPRATIGPTAKDFTPTKISSSISGLPLHDIPEFVPRKRRAPLPGHSEDETSFPAPTKRPRLDNYLAPSSPSPFYSPAKSPQRVAFPSKFSSPLAIPKRNDFSSSPMKPSGGLHTPATSPYKRPFSPPVIDSPSPYHAFDQSRPPTPLPTNSRRLEEQQKTNVPIIKLSTTVSEVQREFIDLTGDSFNNAIDLTSDNEAEADAYTSGRNPKSAFDLTGMTDTQAQKIVDASRRKICRLLGDDVFDDEL